MNTKTQLQWTKDRLLYDGEVSRNAALQMYITRLGARINDLKNVGWEINGKWVKTEQGKDFVYYLVSSPLKKVTYHVPELNKTIDLFQ